MKVESGKSVVATPDRRGVAFRVVSPRAYRRLETLQLLHLDRSDALGFCVNLRLSRHSEATLQGFPLPPVRPSSQPECDGQHPGQERTHDSHHHADKNLSWLQAFSLPLQENGKDKAPNHCDLGVELLL